MPAAADGVRHVLGHAADITQAAEKLRLRPRDQIHRAAFVCACFRLDHLDDAAAHPSHPQRRQCDDRMQKPVRGVKLEAAETDRHVGRGLKSPKHVTGTGHVVSGQACLGERGPKPVALPGRKRRRKQPAHAVTSAICPAN